MAEFYGGDYIADVINNDPTLTALLPGNTKAVASFNSRMVPETETADNTVNYYPVQAISGGLEYFESFWTLNCRSTDEKTSLNIANALYTAFNRHNYTVNGKMYFGIIEITGTIIPLDSEDKWNTPVSLTIRRR